MAFDSIETRGTSTDAGSALDSRPPPRVQKTPPPVRFDDRLQLLVGRGDFAHLARDLRRRRARRPVSWPAVAVRLHLVEPGHP